MLKITPSIRYFDRNFREDRIPDCELRIQFSENEISFSVFDPIPSAFQLIEKYFIQKNHRVIKPVEALAREMQANSLTRMPFSSVELICTSELYTLVPKAFFDEYAMDSYLKLGFKINQAFHTGYAFLKQPEIYLLYALPSEIQSLFHSFYPNSSINHYLTYVLEGAFSLSNNPSFLTVHVHEKHLDIIFIRDGKLILCNGFSFSSPEDFVYYLLLVYERQELNREETPVYFCGDLTIQSGIFNLCKKYIRDLFFLERSDLYTVPPAEDHDEPLLPHSFYSLLHSPQ